VIDAVTGAIGDAIDGAAGILGLGSPSKVFHDMGVFTMDGYRNGIEAGSVGLFNTMDRILDEVRSRAAEIASTAEQARSTTNQFTGERGRQGEGPRQGGFTAEQKRYINEVARQRGENLPFPGYRMGIGYVPRDGLAMLHRGEAVIPAKENRVSTESGGFNNYGTIQVVLPNVREPQDFPKELDRYMRGF
jgi:hypothetical protein